MDSANDFKCWRIRKSLTDIEIYGNNVQNCEENEEKKNMISLNNFVPLLLNGCAINNSTDVKKITVLKFCNCDLTEVPDLLERLENLKELRLTNNKLTKIPTCLYKGLSSLEILDLSFNEVKNFDVEPRCHSVLKELYLKDNKFDNIPSWILALRAFSLEKLDYSQNIITELKSLLNKFYFKLTDLVMKNTTMRDIDLPFVKKIETLEHLDISNILDEKYLPNRFENLDSLFIGVSWKNMQILNMNNLHLGVVPNGITWVESLRELHLTYNNLSYLPNNMELLVNLEVLDASNNDLSYLPSNFYLLTSLRVLKLAYNMLSELEDIRPMMYLETLDLYCNRLNEFKSYMDTIKFIDLEQNYFETEDCEFYEDYLNKKITYHKKLPDDEHRKSGIGMVLDPHIGYTSSDRYSDSSSESEEQWYDEELEAQRYDDELQQTCDEEIEYCNGIEEENWDEDFRKHEKHPDVTPSDDEWQGEIKIPKNIDKYSRGKTIIYNSEWMFCDANEEDITTL